MNLFAMRTAPGRLPRRAAAIRPFSRGGIQQWTFASRCERLRDVSQIEDFIS